MADKGYFSTLEIPVQKYDSIKYNCTRTPTFTVDWRYYSLQLYYETDYPLTEGEDKTVNDIKLGLTIRILRRLKSNIRSCCTIVLTAALVSFRSPNTSCSILCFENWDTYKPKPVPTTTTTPKPTPPKTVSTTSTSTTTKIPTTTSTTTPATTTPKTVPCTTVTIPSTKPTVTVTLTPATPKNAAASTTTKIPTTITEPMTTPMTASTTPKPTTKTTREATTTTTGSETLQNANPPSCTKKVTCDIESCGNKVKKTCIIFVDGKPITGVDADVNGVQNFHYIL
ncbi:hypothetical protein L596_028829 [Steinernema carpocapsae]|uniref:Uncharacterized protein n=1 Tax=Steinernema carpocapsae TaxID=34508 RepID=A0A4U5LZH3_STECR|nr:hypothetical protein L596_028829 [Steinernema carpocapsae]